MATDGKPSNSYIHRKAATPKACFVCYKQTPHVLVSQSIPTLDFVYICHAHLADRHFATKLSDPPASTSTATSSTSASGERLPDKVSQDEIEKIKKEYEEKLKAKEKEKEKEKESKPMTAMSVAGSVFSTVTSTVSGLASTAISSIPTEARVQTPAAAAPTGAAASAATLEKQHPIHETYSLHREFYAARVRQWQTKMFKKKESELNMPPAPKNALS